MAPVSVLELDLLKCISNRFWLQCSCKALLQFFSVKASALSQLRMGDHKGDGSERHATGDTKA